VILSHLLTPEILDHQITAPCADFASKWESGPQRPPILKSEI